MKNSLFRSYKFCISMSKIARAECKMKTRFQTLLRRSRFSSEAQSSLVKPRFRSLTMQKYCIFLTPQSLSFHASGNPSDLTLLFRKSFRNSSFCPHKSIQKTLGNVPSSYNLTTVRTVRKFPFRKRVLHQGTIIV